MKKAIQKLHSQSGASILVALLFLLACMMVGGSVLTAAASNAGKIKSNYDEQQRYLALSSALRLVSDHLERAQYRGQYTVNEWTETITVTEEDEEGKRHDRPPQEYNYYMVRQTAGAFSCGQLAELKKIEFADPDNPGLKGETYEPDGITVLTFQKELDGVFKEEFDGTGYQPLKNDSLDPADYPLADLPTDADTDSSGFPREVTTRKLTVKVGGDPSVQEKFPDITVEVDMSETRRIHLKATMPAAADGEAGLAAPYILEAELAPVLIELGEDGKPDTKNPVEGGMTAVEYAPAGARMPADRNGGELYTPIPKKTGNIVDVKAEITKDERTGCVTTAYLTWKLDWISREIEEEADG